jgi:hypothetical protein
VQLLSQQATVGLEVLGGTGFVTAVVIRRLTNEDSSYLHANITRKISNLGKNGKYRQYQLANNYVACKRFYNLAGY